VPVGHPASMINRMACSHRRDPDQRTAQEIATPRCSFEPPWEPPQVLQALFGQVIGAFNSDDRR
jgi:hypothetical protein